jgi:hypothetical protein
MAWLWLLVPVVLLGAAFLLWRATVRLDGERRDLEAQIAAMRASGPEPGHR